MKQWMSISLALLLSLAILSSCAFPCGKKDAEPEPPVESQSKPEEVLLNEGVDTKIEITGYTTYSGALESYFLSEGDKIAVISPSGLPDEEQVSATVKGLKAWGYEPVAGSHASAEIRTLDECMEDFRQALEDPEIKAIFCVRGGYGATEVMDALPADLIATARKPIIGYSDITVYHSAWTSAGLPSIHGCMSGTFTGLPEACAQAERSLLKGEIPSYKCEANQFCRQGTAEGVLIGGNLSTFAATLETAYDCTKINEPYILFIEEVGEDLRHIHRFLTVLKHHGVLDNAAGIVFGEWTELPDDGAGNYGRNRGGLFDSAADMITRQLLEGIDVPVAFGFPAGHGDVNYPLLMGEKATLTVAEDSFTLSSGDSQPASES